jgi:hypothetical protein
MGELRVIDKSEKNFPTPTKFGLKRVIYNENVSIYNVYIMKIYFWGDLTYTKEYFTYLWD